MEVEETNTTTTTTKVSVEAVVEGQVERYEDGGEKTMKKDPPRSKVISDALASLTGSGAVAAPQATNAAPPSRLEQVLVNLSYAVAEVERIVHTLQLCAGENVGLANVIQQQSQSADQARAATALAFFSKKAALEDITRRLREGAERARAACKLRGAYLADVNSLRSRWRMVPLPGNTSLQQADFALVPGDLSSLEILQPSVPLGNAQVVSCEPAFDLRISSCGGESRAESSSARRAERPVATVAVGSKQCHSVLAGLQRSLLARETFSVMKEEAVKQKHQARDPSAWPLHCVLDDPSSLVCCGRGKPGSCTGLSVKLVERGSPAHDLQEFGQQEPETIQDPVGRVLLVAAEGKLLESVAGQHQKKMKKKGGPGTSKGAKVLEMVAKLHSQRELVDRVISELDSWLSRSESFGGRTVVHCGKTIQSYGPPPQGASPADQLQLLVTPVTVIGPCRRAKLLVVDGREVRLVTNTGTPLLMSPESLPDHLESSL